MSEELLKAIIQLFAIVARERITEDERTNIKEFLSLHLNQEAIKYYLNLFDDFTKTHRVEATQDVSNLDLETQQFVDDWAKIMQIVKKVNQALTMQQKLVLVVKIIELVYADFNISERQGNLIFYIGQALKIPQADIDEVIEYAKLKSIPLTEAIQSNVVKAILADKAEHRASADATNTGAARRGSSKVSDETLLANANKGIVPEDDEGMKRLIALTTK